MIKNESRIIVRSILSSLRIADAVVISDTGSTDTTIQVLEDFYPSLTIPAKTYQHPWTNFGVNRTLSCQDAFQFCMEKGWPIDKTYALAIDADMELVVESAFNKQTDLGSQKGYSLIQKAGTLHYANARLLRLDHPWTCKGATHEYWDGPMGASISDTKLWINDRNDGGCKADKFTRDLALLQKELETEPLNVRTHFYLAQTYKCLGQREQSIEVYKKRIELGGWYEEVWYSYYMLGQLYLELGKPFEAELWIQKGHQHNGYRAEALYLLVKHFRIAGDQWKAMHYYFQAKRISKPAVALFLESEIYDHLLDYEYTILQYYVNPLRIEGCRASLQYMLKPQSNPLLENVASNMEFYIEGLKENPVSIATPTAIGPYRPSSVAVTRHKGFPITNVRFVNYHTSDQGVYTARDPEGIVRTQNLTLGQTTFIQEDATIPTWPTNIMGLEDIRLFSTGDRILYTATSKAVTANGTYRIVMGTYDVSNQRLTDSQVIQPPTQTECEKNWLLLPCAQGQEQILYKWNPLEIGTVRNNQLVIHQRHEVPPYFSRLRGSANGVLYKDTIVCLTHVVKYGTPRKYYHHLVTLDKTTYKPLAISLPFYFKTHGIEYCLGFDMINENITFYYSTFDAHPRTITVPYSSIEYQSISTFNQSI